MELLLQILTTMHEMFFCHRAEFSSAFGIDEVVESRKEEVKREREDGRSKPLGKSWDAAKPLRHFEYVGPDGDAGRGLSR